LGIDGICFKRRKVIAHLKRGMDFKIIAWSLHRIYTALRTYQLKTRGVRSRDQNLTDLPIELLPSSAPIAFRLAIANPTKKAKPRSSILSRSTSSKEKIVVIIGRHETAASIGKETLSRCIACC
jgi:hypothetical protein